MKNLWGLILIFVVFACILGASPVAAEMNQYSGLEGGSGQSSFGAGSLESQSVFLLNNLVGRDVVNQQDQQLGSVQNVVIRPDGRVSYIILSPAQGMQGSNQLVAVPWNAANPSLRQNKVVMNLGRNQIENSPKLPSGNLAQLQNEQMQQRINTYFGAGSAEQGVQVPQRMGIEQPFHDGAISQTQADYRRVDRLIGEPVVNEQGDRLGTVEDALISQDGQMRYLVILRSGAPEQSPQLTIIPWNAAQPSFQPDRVIVSVRRQALDNALQLSQDQMDRLQTPEFQQRLFSYYGNQSAGAAAFPTRANEIIGELVVNPQGDELGTVKDMVTTESGCVKYLLLSPSEQLAMGSQLIALPWNLIQRDRRQNAVVMNISMQELKDAPAFETQNWRDYVNNPQFDQRVYNYFQAQPGRVSTGALQPQSDLDVVRATTLIGTMVADQDGQPVGTLRDLMMDDRGKIKYLLISSQNDPSRIVAVPWDIADPGIVQNTLIIDVSQDSFLNAPAFSMNNWRRLKSQQWENRVNSYFRPEQQGEYIEIF